MKTPEQLAERREKMRLYMAERRKDPVQAALNRERVKAWQKANPEKARASSKAWRTANPERVKEHNKRWYAEHSGSELQEHHRQCYRRTRRAFHLNKKFGLTEAQYHTMLMAQGHRCALCTRADLPEKRLAVDHDHVTGKIRALLCDRCNRGIGLLGDDPIQLRKAAEYLARHKLTTIG